MEQVEKNNTNTSHTVHKRRVLSGTVVGTKMQDTATVAVERYVKHVKYKKYMRRTKKYLVHDKGNTVGVGDKVTIEECTPISKRKHFVLKEVKRKADVS